MMENTKQNQWDWLKSLPAGSRVVCGDGTVWLKSDSWLDCYWVNLETGAVTHFSSLANEIDPPREYTRRSPFSGEAG